MDSISILKITELLEQRYGTLPKTMFFEYTTLGEVASHRHPPAHRRAISPRRPSSAGSGARSLDGPGKTRP